MRSSVDLPAPFAPTMARQSPASMANVACRNSSIVEGYRNESPETFSKDIRSPAAAVRGHWHSFGGRLYRFIKAGGSLQTDCTLKVLGLASAPIGAGLNPYYGDYPGRFRLFV